MTLLLQFALGNWLHTSFSQRSERSSDLSNQLTTAYDKLAYVAVPFLSVWWICTFVDSSATVWRKYYYWVPACLYCHFPVAVGLFRACFLNQLLQPNLLSLACNPQFLLQLILANQVILSQKCLKPSNYIRQASLSSRWRCRLLVASNRQYLPEQVNFELLEIINLTVGTQRTDSLVLAPRIYTRLPTKNFLRVRPRDATIKKLPLDKRHKCVPGYTWNKIIPLSEISRAVKLNHIAATRILRASSCSKTVVSRYTRNG